MVELILNRPSTPKRHGSDCQHCIKGTAASLHPGRRERTPIPLEWRCGPLGPVPEQSENWEGQSGVVESKEE